MFVSVCSWVYVCCPCRNNPELSDVTGCDARIYGKSVSLRAQPEGLMISHTLRGHGVACVLYCTSLGVSPDTYNPQGFPHRNDRNLISFQRIKSSVCGGFVQSGGWQVWKHYCLANISLYSWIGNLSFHWAIVVKELWKILTAYYQAPKLIFWLEGNQSVS